MVFEKKLIIGISIASCLIEAYDDCTKDSATTNSNVIDFCKNNFNYTITEIDFELGVDILNKSCTRKDFITKHTFNVLLTWDRIISTECRKDYLLDIREQLQDELEKVSTLY